jgi:hypothetical protein
MPVLIGIRNGGIPVKKENAKTAMPLKTDGESPLF